MSQYPDGMRLRPIEAWPGVLTRDRVRAPFSASWTNTIETLDRELWHLGPAGRNATSVLQIAMREHDFRRDGMPRANATPEHPGVILAVESTKGSLSFPCDRFTRWQDNLRAITLGMEALRKVARYGITPGDQQYTGWRQIEATAAAPNPAGAEEALRLFGGRQAEGESLRDVYRRAIKATHPDRGGRREDFDRVQAAGRALGVTS